MSEFEVRLAGVLGAVLVGIAISFLVRRRSDQHQPVAVRQASLGVGVYLFTSASCPDCEVARRALLGALGPIGYSELTWESDPEIFHEIGVDAVPATLFVTDTGVSVLYPGRPDRLLEGLSP